MNVARILGVIPLALSLAACSSGPKFEAKAPPIEVKKRIDGSIDDRSMCEYKGRADREASEVAGPGSVQPNVRRVYQLVGMGEDRHKVLVCREIDTNFDGIKDVVRHYNDKGESIAEEADSNYDGRIDTWLTFVKGRLIETKIDNNFDGKPDEWKHYSNGRLTRVVRDANFDGKPDVWEIYREGKLERMGVDIDGDERVDRWDHDNELRRRLEEQERKKEEEALAAKAKKAQEDKEAADKADGENPDANPPADKPGDKPADKPKPKAPAAKRKPAAKK